MLAIFSVIAEWLKITHMLSPTLFLMVTPVGDIRDNMSLYRLVSSYKCHHSLGLTIYGTKKGMVYRHHWLKILLYLYQRLADS